MSNFEFKKKFGQNFLTDDELLEEIVEKSGTTSDDIVLEIGAGKGALTSHLSNHAKQVISFEIDKTLTNFLTDKFKSSNVKFIFDDIMSYSDDKLNEIIGGKFRLVANLPYYITSPILTRFLQNPNLISATVMVQEEVADRIIAKPKTKDYGVLTIICNLFGKSEKVMRVNRTKFYPIPNVDSAVVRIDKNNSDLDFDYLTFISFVKQAFSMRRKKLTTNLENNKITKSQLEEIFTNNKINTICRAEELSLDEFINLYKILKRYYNA